MAHREKQIISAYEIRTFCRLGTDQQLRLSSLLHITIINSMSLLKNSEFGFVFVGRLGWGVGGPGLETKS